MSGLAGKCGNWLHPPFLRIVGMSGGDCPRRQAAMPGNGGDPFGPPDRKPTDA